MPSKVISSAPPVSPASSGLTLLFCPYCSEVELPLKKDGFTSESTTLEALLRGEGVEKKVDAREEESIQEIQVFLCPGAGGGRPLSIAGVCPDLLCQLGSSSQGPGLHLKLPCGTVAGSLQIFFSDLTCLPEEVIVPLKFVPLP